MKILKMKTMRLSGLMMLLCILGISRLGEAAPLAQIPTSPITGYLAPGQTTRTPDYYTTANWANSPPLAKFVDTLPGLGSGKPNNRGQFLPIATADQLTYPGSDYYIIELREYFEKMHSDLQPTKLRGYVQVTAGGQNGAADVAPIHYLGPVIIAERDRPVRLKFINSLPAGSNGNLFIPVDTSVMGAGTGPADAAGAPCDNTSLTNANGCASYTQNRADIHLHGGRTPWISDGTPHQWIIPAADQLNPSIPFKKGVSMQNVPDMPDPGPGAATYYFTNQQSARLMFYHDHAFGITRLNVYAGEAAGYLITDKYEQDLVTRGIIPADQIPLIIQDKTYVDATPVTHPVTGNTVPKIRVTDPLWNWGSGTPDGNGVRPPVTGDLWLPHVYMPAQTQTGGIGGVNPFGRWMYGPWFYPATSVVQGPVDNPYYDLDCSSLDPFVLANCQTPGQPTQIPGTPNVSMGMEAFQDSVVVNGTVFPTLTVDPRAYRFRVLNAASDRFWNLSFYIADSSVENVSPDNRLNPSKVQYIPGRSNNTEVKILPAAATLAAENDWPPLWPTDGRDGGVPDPAFRGPNFLQIGSEGGFLPKPVEIEPQPITYMTDPTAFWVGVVDKMGLALGPAERADVIVDFTAYAGKTLILYNDAPAAWPARVAGYDYYTGAPDMRDSGGFGTGGTFDPASGAWIGGSGPLPGYAPNTRTVMQIIVSPAIGQADPAPASTFNRARLEREFTSLAPVVAGVNPAPAKSLFERSQEPIIVGQAAYKDAYPNSYFPINFPWEGIAQINDQSLQFVTLAGEQVIIPTEPKGIHDEMGASFDPIYGRMSGNLAMQVPNPTTLNALLILYGYSDLPTETINNSTSINVQVLPNLNPLLPGTRNDGTQIWKISHNGVDTHPIHFHIFDVQLVNRVGWDGQILMPEPNELGWKDTVKISPLMDTIVAVRPRAPSLPFGIPNSLRPLNPSIPIDSVMGFTPPPAGSDFGFGSIDPTTGQAYVAPFPYDNYKGVVTNILYDFGWEYVWHCHILSHEEMDMMRPIVLKVASTVPAAPTILSTAGGVITWTDPTPVTYTNYSTYGDSANEVGFNVYRSNSGGPFVKLNAAKLLANSTSFTDAAPGAAPAYLVEAFNAAGSSIPPVASLISVVVDPAGPFAVPATVPLAATVTLNGATVQTVEFYNGATLLGTGTRTSATPNIYTFSWAPVVVQGIYTITAKVTDSTGATSLSAPISVTVNGTLTADFTPNGGTFTTCDVIPFTSTSTGPITGYTWLINNTHPTTPVVNTKLPPGTYQISLAVINSATGETAQVTKSITISGTNTPPTVTSTGGPYTISNAGNLILNGTGADADACDVLSYSWNIDNIGNYDYFTSNPTISYSTLNNAIWVGTHTITFKVTDLSGAFATATTTLTVEAVAPPATITVPATSSTGNYTISWAASSPSGVTYTLEESTDNFATYPLNTIVVTSGTNATSANISGKVNGNLFYYRVRAVPVDPFLNPTLWATGANGISVTGTLTANFTFTGSANGADIGFCESISFASTSVTSAGPITGYSWMINGNNYTTSSVVTLLAPGTYPVTLTITKGSTGETAQITKNVTIINHNPTAISGGPYPVVAPGGSLNLVGSGTDILDSCNVAPLTYAWKIGSSDYFNANPAITYNTLNTVVGVGTHTITFTVTDSNGGVGASTTAVKVGAAAPAAITVPATNTTGNYTVSWTASSTSGVTYTLQESTDPLFPTTTETPNAVSPVSISGKVNGVYYYRVKAVPIDVSLPETAWTTGANGCAVLLDRPVITAPATEDIFATGASITITATAPTGSAGSSVTKVEFFDNGVLVGTDTVAPFSTTWSSGTTGQHSLTATSYYSNGAITTSAAIAVSLVVKDGLLPGTTGQLASAMKALQIAKGNIIATPADLAHADVSPYVNGSPTPDGKIDLGDVYVLLLNLVGVLGL